MRRNMHGNRFDAVDRGNAVDWDHPHNRGLKYWNLVPPGVQAAGGVWPDLVGRNTATLTGQTSALPMWGARTPRGDTPMTSNGTSQYLTTPFKINNLAPADGSISWWANPTIAFNGGGQYIWYGEINSYEFSAQSFQGTILVGWNGASDYRVTVITSATNWVQNQWSHYELTWVSGGQSVLYMNGVAIANNGATATVVGAPSDVMLLGSFTSNALYFPGSLADYRIWNYAHSATEVWDRYQMSSVGYQSPDSPLRWLSTRSYFVSVSVAVIIPNRVVSINQAVTTAVY